MFILDNLIKFISSLFMMGMTVYAWHKFLNKKMNYTSIKNILVIVSLSLISILNYYIVNQYIRIFSITLILIIYFSFLFKENIQKCIITPIFCQIIIMISETIYLLVMTIFFKNNLEQLLANYLGNFMTNVVITFIAIMIVRLKFIINIYNKIINFTLNVKKLPLLSLSIVIIIALAIFPITIYCHVDIKYLLLFYSSMIILCSLIVFYSLKTQNMYNEVYNKYNVAAQSLKDYENMMSRYRILNHENKNLLLTIRAMILNNDKDIPKYIDSIVEEKYEDDEKLLFDVSVIPAGGLRATIYSEVLKIKGKNIKYLLEMDKKISTIDFIQLDEKTIIEICKIISVFIDNAIDEVSSHKNKFIGIHLYNENNKIIISISNKYQKKIDVNKIYDIGYSTKGNNHGYGLALVKNIIEKNNLLENQIDISKDLFKQILKIKYKKN